MSKPFFEAGRYWAKVIGQQFGEAKTGNPQFVLRIAILGKLDPVDPKGDLISCPSGERTIWRTITDKTIDRFIQDLQTLGFKGTSFSQLEPKGDNYHNLSGTEVPVYCEHETSNQTGELREQWGIVNEGGAPQVKELDPKGIRKLDALFGKQLKALSAPEAASAAPQGKPPKPAPERSDRGQALQKAAAERDDGIPFSFAPFLLYLSAIGSSLI